MGARGSARPPTALNYRGEVPPEPFVPADFEPPTALVTDSFRREPFGDRHSSWEHDVRCGR